MVGYRRSWILHWPTWLFQSTFTSFKNHSNYTRYGEQNKNVFQSSCRNIPNKNHPIVKCSFSWKSIQEPSSHALTHKTQTPCRLWNWGRIYCAHPYKTQHPVHWCWHVETSDEDRYNLETSCTRSDKSQETTLPSDDSDLKKNSLTTFHAACARVHAIFAYLVMSKSQKCMLCHVFDMEWNS